MNSYLSSYSSYYNNSNPTVSIVVSIIMIVAMWRIFEKAGEAGWKSLIPIYNMYMLWKIVGMDFGKFFLIVFIGFILVGVLATSLGAIAIVLVFVLAIYCIVEAAKLCSNLSRAFGHGTGFAVGLFFLGPIFYCILAFSGDTYQGVN